MGIEKGASFDEFDAIGFDAWRWVVIPGYERSPEYGGTPRHGPVAFLFVPG